MPPTKNKNVQAESAKLGYNDNVFQLRERVATADVNAGYTLLPAIRGYKYRIIDMALISEGGAASGATSVNIIGTRAAAAVQLLAAAVAGLTQNTLLRAGAANAAILAAGASFEELDAETAITIDNVGGALATTTFIHALITYALVPARSGS